MELSLKAVLMERDNLTESQALRKIAEAKKRLTRYFDTGNMEKAENICFEMFGLEPDYLFELM